MQPIMFTDAFALLAYQTPDPRSSWAPVLLLLIIGIGFAVGNVVLSVIIGPSRTAYERVIPIVDITAKLLGSALNSRA